MNQLRKCYVLAIMLVGLTFGANGQVKIGYFNSTVLLQEIPDVKQANANLEALSTQLQKKYEGMVQAFQQKYQELSQKKQRGELSPKQEQDEGAKLQEEQTKIGQQEQEMQLQLENKRKELLQPILDDVSNKVAEVAKENGYSYIMDEGTGVLLFKDEAADVTDLVKAKLGLQ